MVTAADEVERHNDQEDGYLHSGRDSEVSAVHVNEKVTLLRKMQATRRTRARWIKSTCLQTASVSTILSEEVQSSIYSMQAQSYNWISIAKLQSK